MDKPKTKWVSVPINKEEFIARGNSERDWKQYLINQEQNGWTAFVRREVEVLDEGQ